MTGSSQDTALAGEHLTVGYGDLIVVRDVDVVARRGRGTLLLGHNGAGKTTTLLGLAGHLPLTEGRVTMMQRDVTKLAPYARAKAGLMYVAAGHRVFAQRSVEENLRIALAAGTDLGRAMLASKLEETFERFALLASKRRQRAGLLSGGQQQLLALAQAFAVRPAVLLLDEPSAGLAPRAVEDCMEVVREMMSHGTAVVLVEQRPELVADFCEETIVLENGRSRANTA